MTSTRGRAETGPTAGEDTLGDADRAVLARIDEGNTWLRAVLCTLARRGTLLRQEEPERAAPLLEALSRWPWFKGGQFLFDLMEWEDFMVDGPPPPLVASVLGSGSVRRIASALAGTRALLDDAAARAFDDARRAYEQLTVDIAAAEEHLPALQPGLYLYRDVVLGVVVSVGPIVAEADRSSDAPPS